MRIDRDIAVEPGQPFVVERFRPEDAPGVAHLFYSEYGPSYPIETFYYPERIIAENANGNIHSVVARTPRGDIIGHGALFRSSPEFPDLYEIGQCIVLPAYRVTFAAYKLNKFAGESLPAIVRPAGIFGEAVTHITATQKISAQMGLKDVALEMDLMPAEAYQKSGSAPGRVTCLIMFRPCDDSPREMFVPSCYREIVEYVYHDVPVVRTRMPSSAGLPDTRSVHTNRFFGFARVSRTNVTSAGADFETLVDTLEGEGRKSEALVSQFFLNLGEPWVGAAVEILRARRYSFGGCAPRWFDSDGLLMQRLAAAPDFGAPRLYSAKARSLLEFVRSDMQAP